VMGRTADAASMRNSLVIKRLMRPAFELPRRTGGSRAVLCSRRGELIWAVFMGRLRYFSTMRRKDSTLHGVVFRKKIPPTPAPGRARAPTQRCHLAPSRRRVKTGSGRCGCPRWC
jgi:hypothetical protein